MGSRYYFEIVDGPSKYYHFAYFDTHDHLADFLFTHEQVDVTIEGEFAADDDPYRIIMCRIPMKQREKFLQCIGMLPALMDNVGKTDYDEFCIHFMRDAGRYMQQNAPRTNIPLQ